MRMRQLPRSMSSDGFDMINRQILQILQKEGRITNVELAERVGIPATSMSDRIRRLQDEGIISSFGAVLNPMKVGLSLLVSIEIRLDNATPQVFEKFAKAVNTAPEVIECHMVGGGFDYLVKTRFGSMESYRTFLGMVVLNWPGVSGTNTYVVLEEIKQNAPLAVI